MEFVVVGGFGAQAHGAHRQTSDIDVVPRSTDDNLTRLAAALAELHARLRVGGMTDDEARKLPVTIDAATLRSFGVRRGPPTPGQSTCSATLRSRADAERSTSCGDGPLPVECTTL